MDKNCTYWSDSEHYFEEKIIFGTFTELTEDNKKYYRKLCLCGTVVKSRAEITDNPKTVYYSETNYR